MQHFFVFCNLFHKKRVSYLRRTAQPPTLAAFRPWGDSAGAGRAGLTPPQKYKFLNYRQIKNTITNEKLRTKSYELKI